MNKTNFNFQKNRKSVVKLLSVASISSTILAFANPVQAVNLIFNGDFEVGNTGFSTNYAYDSTNGRPPGVYAVGPNPNDLHPSWLAFGDHTTGTGNMMIVNGSTTGNQTVWSQLVDVAANTNYQFSAWVASSFPVSPAHLLFRINSTALGAFEASETPGVWERFSANWFSGADTSATITIVDLNTQFMGNDFAIDDISLQLTAVKVSEVPEPSGVVALAAMGFMLGVSLNSRRKRHQATTDAHAVEDI